MLVPLSERFVNQESQWYSSLIPSVKVGKDRLQTDRILPHSAFGPIAPVHNWMRLYCGGPSVLLSLAIHSFISSRMYPQKSLDSCFTKYCGALYSINVTHCTKFLMFCFIGRQWAYQSCNEFGFFVTTTSKNQPFSGMPLR